MNARSFTLPNGDVGWVVPEAVEFVRPVSAAEQWPELANTVIYLAGGQTVVVREPCAAVIATLFSLLNS